MYVRRNVRWSLIARFAARNIMIFTVWATCVTAAWDWAHRHSIELGVPFLPISTIGVAVAFYLGFKNNQAYGRFWEARQLWGGILNTCRGWGAQVISVMADRSADDNESRELRRRLVLRQLGWINALRLQLRATTIFDRQNLSYVPDLRIPRDVRHASLETFLSPEELTFATERVNGAAQLLKLQCDDLQLAHRRGVLDDFRYNLLLEQIQQCFTMQGGCERIKNTPFPRQYAYFSTVFVRIFVFLLPLGLVTEFAKLGAHPLIWLTVPFSVIISWIFTTMEIVGDNSEDPFENYINDVPMSAICRTIEIDLFEMLGESPPPKLTPVDDILM